LFEFLESNSIAVTPDTDVGPTIHQNIESSSLQLKGEMMAESTLVDDDGIASTVIQNYLGHKLN
jgi:hypothetical protein